MATKKITNKAQTVIEYIAVVTLLAAVFIAMGAYYKRGLQERLKQAGDAIGSGEQYTPVSP
ncbi:MAG: hypothetical protein V1869_00035 [Candidatus Omnitrophota bacterium]